MYLIFQIREGKLMHSLFKTLFLCTIACLLTAMPLQAAVYYWNNTDWGYVDDPANWANGLVPGYAEGDRAAITGGGLALITDTHTFGPTPIGSGLGIYSLFAGVEDPTIIGSGAIQQSGSTVTTNAGLILGYYSANASYGYYGISGGTLNTSGNGGDPRDVPLYIGSQGPSVFNQTGGTTNIVVTTGSWSRTIIGGTTSLATSDNLMNIRGGTFNGSTAPTSPDFGVLLGWGGRQNTLNIGGTATMDLTHGGATPIGKILMGAGGSMATLNVGDVSSTLGGSGGTAGGGGTLITSSITGINTSTTKNVNFHGGVLQASTSTPVYDFLSGVNAYVYSEGAVIDTHGYNVTVSSALLDPSASGGNGVTGIVLGSSKGSGYIGEPLVTLTDSGGTGTGATARAIVDLNPGSSTFGQITSLVITNPGMNYTGTVTASFIGGDPTVAIDPNSVAVATSTNQSGGLRKIGPGTLTLSAVNTYTGLSKVESGVLDVTGSIAGSADVFNTATLLGTGFVNGNVNVQTGGTVSGNLTVYGTTTLNTGATIDPGAVSGSPTGTVTFSSLNLQKNSNLHFDINSNTSYDKIIVNGGYVYPDPNPPSPSPITVNVSYSGTATDTVTLLEANYGYFDPDSRINFVLSGGSAQTLDSPDGVNTGYLLVPTRGYNGSLKLSLNNPITDPAWNNFSGTNRNFSTGANWGPPNTAPLTGAKRAMFTKNIGNGVVSITLDVSPTLSSMIFDNPGGERYNITPLGSNFITMNSSLTSDWHITVLGGEHTIAANIKMAKGTGSSEIRLKDGTHLTLSGVLSDSTTDPSNINFNGAFNGIGTGVLTLSGANTYTGKTTLNGGVLQVASLGNVATANPLGKSSADPANLVLNAGTLQYTGSAGGSTDRGFTVAGNATLRTDNNATFIGQINGNAGTTLTIIGAGKTTFGYAGTSTLNSMTIGSTSPGKVEIMTGTLTFNDVADQGNLWLGDNAVGTLSVAGTAEVNARNLLVGKTGGADAGVGGAIYQTGGTVNVLGDGVNPVDLGFKGEVLGHSAYGYYNMAGGVLNMNVNARSGYNPFLIGLNAPAVFDQTGGTVNNPATSNILLGVYGNAVMNVTGGAFRMSNNFSSSGILVGNISEGTLNIGGGTSSALVDLTAGPVAGSIIMGRIDSQGTINLRTNGILKVGGIYGANAFPGESQGSAVFNFHGGTISFGASYLPSGATSSMEAINYAYLYSEGGTIDTNGIDTTIAQGIEDPTASGIKRIDVVGGGSGYIGTPLVTISGGSGFGATAVAVMNGDKVDHFVITNPGSGYSPDDSLSVTLTGGGFTTAANLSIGTGTTYFAANSGGALQKVGDGTLTLSGMNNYAGLTSVKGGGLSVTGSLTGGVDVYSDATLRGSGYISGDVNVRSGGMVAPTSLSTLSLNGNMTLQNDTKMSFDYDGISVSNIWMSSAKPTVSGTTVIDFHPSVPVTSPTALTVLFWAPYETLAAGSLIPSKDSIGRCTFRLDLSIPGLVNILYNPIENEWQGPAGGSDWNYFNTGNWTSYVPGAAGSSDLQKQAVFGSLGTAGSVNVNGPLTLSSLIFDNADASYNLDGSTITMESTTTAAAQIAAVGSLAAGHIVANAMTLSSNTDVRATGTLILSGSIGGSHAPVLYGDNVSFAGHNTYSGVTVDNAIQLVLSSPTGQAIPGNLTMSGTWLWMGAANQFGAASVVTFKSGEWVLNGNNQTVAGISSADNVGIIENSHQSFPGLTVSDAVLTVNNASPCTFTGMIRDHGGADSPGFTLGLTKAGNAVLTLTGPLTYSGPTTIEAGTLQINATNVLTGEVVRGSTTSGTLEVGGTDTTLTATGIVDLGAAVIGEGNTLVIGSNVPSTTNVIDQVTGNGTLQVIGSGTKLSSSSIHVDTLIIGGPANNLSAVPEPSTILLFAIAGALGAWFQLRKK
jgi:autotransporter-associated beta strand protein